MEPNKGTTVRAATKMRKLAITMRRKTQSRENLIFSCRGKHRGTHAPLSPSGGELGGSSFFCTNWSFIRFSSPILRYSAVFQQGLVCFGTSRRRCSITGPSACAGREVRATTRAAVPTITEATSSESDLSLPGVINRKTAENAMLLKLMGNVPSHTL